MKTPVPRPKSITREGKGGEQEPIDYRQDLAKHTGGDVNNRRDNKYGKNEQVSAQTLRDALDI